MIFKKLEDGNGGKWVLKKKFTFAALTGALGAIVAIKGLTIATTVEQIVLLFSSLTTFYGWLLGLVFAADIIDKKANGGSYDPKT